MGEKEIGLHSLTAPPGSRKKPKRVGRGKGSGHGKTAGRGHKGQKSRSGHSFPLGFEGGQMPLYRRVPKRGFTNPFRKEYAIINLQQLMAFPKGTEVTPELLKSKGMIKDMKSGLKVLGKGEIDRPLTVMAHKFSQSARQKIEKAGGKAEVIER